jgi:putative thiazole-containing bacteriocin maturation protein
MNSLSPSTRLKVKADTFFIPDPSSDGVYFRNNEGSFRIEGKSIHLWIEKLLPMFNGHNTLEDLTDGLPGPYRNRVYEIAELLYRNGYVRDVSQDLPHQLSDSVVQKYGSQIEFLDSLGGSGAHRFQRYRDAKALAVGSGPFLLSLVSALLESGLSKLHVLITGSTPTHRQRIVELTTHYQKSDPEVAVVELDQGQVGAWQEVVRSVDAVLYANESPDVTELLALQSACRAENRLFVPAVCVEQVGMVGPLVRPEDKVCWESAWRRLHQSAVRKDPELHSFSPTAASLLANVAVFEWFKSVTGVADSQAEPSIFLLNLETLEGNWHSCLPHPLVVGHVSPRWMENLDLHEQPHEADQGEDDVLPYFDRLTNPTTGIFHLWEEGDLKQFPLPQCRVQPVDPLSAGPAPLLPDLVVTGLTHEETRREAGLVGVEAYVARLAESLVPPTLVHPQEFIGVGAGMTAAEGVCRGLSKCLAETLRKQLDGTSPQVIPLKLGTVQDDRCQFYLQSLVTLKESPAFGMGEAVFGFPVVWVGVRGRWCGSVGLNETLALRSALQYALAAQSCADGLATCALERSSVDLANKPAQRLDIPTCEDASWPEVLRAVRQVLERNDKRIDILDLTLEPFLTNPLAGVFGVLLREEESR